MKTLKTSLVLLSSIFVLAACGQKASNGSTTETTQAAQATTTAPTTQVASNKQEATEALPKDGQATYKYEEKGASSTLTYYFKDDIVYKQEAVYTYNPKELGKSDEEVGKFLKKREDLLQGVTGITSTVEKKDGIYIQKATFDYTILDWKELHKRNPKQFPSEDGEPVSYTASVENLLKHGYVKQ